MLKKTVRDSIVAQATKGAAYLDEQHAGWFERVNVGTLDMSDMHRCVLSQMCGGKPYVFAKVDVLGERFFEQAQDYGFTMHLDYEGPIEPYFAYLTRVWVEIIENHQIAADAFARQEKDSHDA